MSDAGPQMPPARLELATRGLKVRRSDRLSYGGTRDPKPLRVACPPAGPVRGAERLFGHGVLDWVVPAPMV
jgi:hypothetical protein